MICRQLLRSTCGNDEWMEVGPRISSILNTILRTEGREHVRRSRGNCCAHDLPATAEKYLWRWRVNGSGTENLFDTQYNITHRQVWMVQQLSQLLKFSVGLQADNSNRVKKNITANKNKCKKWAEKQNGH